MVVDLVADVGAVRLAATVGVVLVAPIEALELGVVVVVGLRVVLVVVGVLPGLPITDLREVAEAIDFRSSSLALMLARWVDAVVEDEVGRRVVVVDELANGRVGGLLRPADVRVAAVGARAVGVVAAAGRRAVEVVAVPANLAVVAARAEPARAVGDVVGLSAMISVCRRPLQLD